MNPLRPLDASIPHVDVPVDVSALAAPALGALALVLVALAPPAAVGALALYRRLFAPTLLATPTRRAVLDFFERRPGETAGAAARILDVDYKTVLHHVRILRRFGLLSSERDGRLIRYRATHPADGDGSD